MQTVGKVGDSSKLNFSSSKNSAVKSSNLFSAFSSRLKPYKNVYSFTRHNSDEIKPKYSLSYKFISESELEAAVNHVRRSKQKKRDEEDWNQFLSSRQERKHEEKTGDSVCELCTTKESTTCAECGLLELDTNILQSTPTHNEEDSMGGKSKEEFVPSTNGVVGEFDTSHSYQLSPGVSKRLQDLLSTINKMSTQLLNPCQRSSYEDEDVDRTIKRSLEFDAMFARNHLYEIQRLLKDTKHSANSKPTNTADLESKISAALKSVTQALEVYTRHVSKGSRVKYQQVLPIFQSITSIEGLLEQLTGQRSFPMRQEIEVSCSYVRQILLEISSTETKTVSTVSHKPVRARKHKPSADLSMYSRRQKAEWRRKSASLARARFGTPGTKKQVQQKEQTSCTKEVQFRHATRAVPEEHVTTMMEMIPPEKSSSGDKGGEEENTKTTSVNSAREHSNVQLLILKEAPPNSDSVVTRATCDSKDYTTLTIGVNDRKEALEYQNKMIDYHKTSPHYKDGKALSIVDRLTKRILTEMIMEFQQDEMDQVIRKLYNLEFE